MLDFASQVGAFIGTSVILFIVTKPKRADDNVNDSTSISSSTDSDTDANGPPINLKGARKYSREGRKYTSFGNHDDFEM